MELEINRVTEPEYKVEMYMSQHEIEVLGNFLGNMSGLDYAEHLEVDLADTDCVALRRITSQIYSGVTSIV